jgi:hypothetical protein
MKSFGKKILTMACVALTYASVNLASAQNADLEVFASKKQTTTDAKASTSLTDKLGLFVRSRVVVDNKNLSTSHLNLVDISYNLGPAEIYAEGFASGGKMVPRVGVQKAGTIGDTAKGHLHYYGSGILSLDRKHDKELLVIARYEKNHAALALEYIANTEGFAITRARMGYHKGKFETGIGFDRYTQKNPKTAANNLGLYVKKTF